MRKKIVTLALAGSLGLGGAVLFTPGLASAQSATPSPSTGNAVTDRLTAIKDALKGLVADDTITQEQADRVATTLAERFPGGRGHGPGGHGPRGARIGVEATAELLDMTVEELRTALESGKTLAQVAEDQDVDRQELIGGLVEEAKEQLAEAVEAGRLTQAQADDLSEDLTARITEKVDRPGGFGRGGHGHGHGRGPAADDDATPSAPATPSTEGASTAA